MLGSLVDILFLRIPAQNDFIPDKLIRSILFQIAVRLKSMQKSELFPTVIKDGALPRKTFSMGHAEDKRFYIEARKITE